MGDLPECQLTDILETIFSRRSIRHYQDRPVEHELLVKLLQAAMAAPTACNSQPREFIVITEPEIMNELRGKLFAGKYNAPVAIVVCGNEHIANNSAGKTYWVQDCSAAMENILIAATGLGLGSVWIGVYPYPSVVKPVQEVLGIPEEVIPLGIAYVGYPAEEKPARTQYDEDRIYWQAYEPRKRKAKVKNAKYQ